MMKDFVYQGKALHELESVTRLKGQEQLDEIEKRLLAMYQHCKENNLIMSKAHIMAVLGLDEITYSRYLAGKVQQRKINTDVDLVQDNKQREQVLSRSRLMKKWDMLAQTLVFDKMAGDKLPTAAIYASKAVFGYSDHDRSDEKPTVSIEVFLKTAKQRQRDKQGKIE